MELILPKNNIKKKHLKTYLKHHRLAASSFGLALAARYSGRDEDVVAARGSNCQRVAVDAVVHCINNLIKYRFDHFFFIFKYTGRPVDVGVNVHKKHSETFQIIKES